MRLILRLKGLTFDEKITIHNLPLFAFTIFLY